MLTPTRLARQLMDYFRRNVAVDAKAGRGKRRECDGGVTQDAEARQRATITKLKKTIAYKSDELYQLRVDVPALVRAVNWPCRIQGLRERIRSADRERCSAPDPAAVMRFSDGCLSVDDV